MLKSNLTNIMSLKILCPEFGTLSYQVDLEYDVSIFDP